MEDLSRNAASYSAFYATYICEKVLKSRHADKAWGMLEQHGLAFRPYEHYLYSPKNIHAFEDDGEVIRFVLSFMGLYGVDSPLPRCYHDQVAIQQRIHGAGEVPLQNFLDIFNNRFYWLYYQAWKKYRFYLQVDNDLDNKVTQQISSFTGRGLRIEDASLDGRIPMTTPQDAPVPRYKLLQLSGILSHRIRSKEGLLILLREFFVRFHVDVKEFVKSMVKVENPPKMGRQFGKDSARLGVHCLVGQWVADYTSRICIVVGPLDFEDYLEFLPEGRFAHLLRFLLQLYLNDSLEYDVKLIVRSDGIGRVPWSDNRLRLGQSLWLGKPRTARIEKYIRHEEYVK